MIRTNRSDEGLTSPPRVLVVDDDARAAEVVAAVAGSLGFEATILDSPEAFLQESSFPGVGCVVIELGLQGMDVSAVEDTLCRSAVSIPLIYVSERPAICDVVRVVRDGALTVLEKPLDKQSLAHELQAAIALSRERRHVEQERQDLLARLATLTPRECEVLALVRLGKTSREIAALIDRSTKTIELHRMNILRKLGVRNVVDLVRNLTALDVDDR